MPQSGQAERVGVVAMTTVIVAPSTRSRSRRRREGSGRRVGGMRQILDREVPSGCHPQPVTESAGVPPGHGEVCFTLADAIEYTRKAQADPVWLVPPLASSRPLLHWMCGRK